MKKRDLIKSITLVVGALLAGYSWLTTISDLPPLVNPQVGILIGVAIFIGIILTHYRDLQAALHEYQTVEANIQVVEILKCDFNVVGETEDFKKNNGIPPQNGISGFIRVENVGWENGEFHWEIDQYKSFLPYPFKFFDDRGGQRFASRYPTVEGRSSTTLPLSLDVDISEKNAEAFAIEMAKPKIFKIHINHWTKRIGGKGEKNFIVLEGDFSTYKQVLTRVWEILEFNNLIKLMDKKW